MVGAFEEIQKSAEGMGFQLSDVIGSAEGLTAMISLMGATNDAYTTTLKDMTSGANAVEEAFEKQAGTVSSQLQVAKTTSNPYPSRSETCCCQSLRTSLNQSHR